MILEVLIAIPCFLIVFIGIQIALAVVRQVQVNKYFKNKSPNLPVADEFKSIIGGNLLGLLFNIRNIYLFGELHKKHGKTLGYYYGNQPAISTIDLELIKTMVIDEPNDHINRCKTDVPIEELEVDSIFCAEDDQWRRIRSASAPAFTNHKIKSPNVMAEINEIIEKFVKSLNDKIDEAQKKAGENFINEDADDLFHRYALALVFKCFYKQGDLVDFYAQQDHWVSLIQAGLRRLISPLLVLCIIFPAIKPLGGWFIYHFTEQGLMRRELRSFIERQTRLNFRARNELNEAKKQADLENRKFDVDNFTLKDGTKFSRNLIDYFIDQYHDGKLTETEYYHNAGFIFLAANKTSADALSLLIHHLAMNQDIQDKLRESIEKQGIESEYLLWCINESMRLYPPGPGGCSKKLNRDYVTKEGYLIPAKTMVYTQAYLIHREPEYWGPDADEYKPERWANLKDFHPVQFLAFGAGKRNCIGKYFAMQEMKMLMGMVMKQFKFERCHKTTDDNTFTAPLMTFTQFKRPHFIKISRLQQKM